jgi:hypothetical protein
MTPLDLLQDRLEAVAEILFAYLFGSRAGGRPRPDYRALCGRRLLVRDKRALVRFFVKTMSMAEDDRYYSQIHEQALHRRIREGRFGRP